MKKMIIALLALVVSGGAGLAGWIFLSQGGALAAMTASETPAADPPVFIQFERLQVPVINDGGIDRLVEIEIVLEVPDTAAGDHILARAPALKDAYLSSLYGTLHKGKATRNGALDLAYVKARLLEAGNGAVDSDWIKDILISTVAERRF